MTAATRTAGRNRVPRGAVGPRSIALLRRVRAAGGSYTLKDNADHEAAIRCARDGLVHVDDRNRDLVHLCDDGVAFLDRLMRAD